MGEGIEVALGWAAALPRVRQMLMQGVAWRPVNAHQAHRIFTAEQNASHQHQIKEQQHPRTPVWSPLPVTTHPEGSHLLPQSLVLPGFVKVESC